MVQKETERKVEEIMARNSANLLEEQPCKKRRLINANSNSRFDMAAGNIFKEIKLNASTELAAFENQFTLFASYAASVFNY